MPRLRRVRPGRDLGYRRLRSGSGFRYVDADGAALPAAERERVVALVIPPAWNDVWICAAANGHVQATGVDEAGRMQYLYHPDWSTTRDKGKYARALQLAECLPRARGRITASLRRDGLDRERVLATAFRLLDQAAPRVGSERYFTAHGSRGLTTLQRRDAAVSGTVTSLRFPGKSGKRQSLEVDDEDLAVVVELLAAGRPAAPLLAYVRGRRRVALTPRDVNVYVRTMTGGSFTAKDFRTLRGHSRRRRPGAHRDHRDQDRPQARRGAGHQGGGRGSGKHADGGQESYIDPRVFARYRRGELLDTTVSPESAIRALLSP